MSKISSVDIKQLAKQHGFDACGISEACVAADVIKKYETWLSNSNNAGMRYLENNLDVRNNLALLLNNAKSVISLLISYNINSDLNNIGISKYAQCEDYHIVVKKNLENLMSEITRVNSNIKMRAFVDAVPLFERYFAQKSGLGFIGKNTCLIHPQFGSWVFIAEIITDIELEYDTFMDMTCGDCRNCIDVCPTGALSEDGLNANKCISYHTIENKSDVPNEIKSKITNQVFGCDICQIVCPHNKQAILSEDSKLKNCEKINNINISELEKMSNRQFAKNFAETSLLRAGRKKIIANLTNVKSAITSKD